MEISISDLHNFEKHNTCFGILKTWFQTESLEQILRELNDPTNAFIPDAAYGAKVSEDRAVNTIIKNLNNQVEFKVTGVDFNCGWPMTEMVIDGIKYWMEWSIDDE